MPLYSPSRQFLPKTVLKNLNMFATMIIQVPMKQEFFFNETRNLILAHFTE